MIDRVDFIFSYWIFLWYLLYECKIIQYNPKLALSIALISNIVPLGLMIYYNNNIIYILLLLFINFFIKVIPLVRLQHIQIAYKDFYYFGILLIFYIVWLLLHHISFSKLNFIDDIKQNKQFSPVIYYLSKQFNYYTFAR